MQNHLGLEIPPMGLGVSISPPVPPTFNATVISLGFGTPTIGQSTITMGYTIP